MTGRVDDDILRSWRAQRADGERSAITFRVVAAGTPVDRMLRALAEVIGTFSDEQQDEGPYRGEWDLVQSGSDVLVTVLECEVLDEVLPGLVSGLEERGVDAAVHLHVARGGAPEWPEPAPLIEVRLRARGHRRHSGGRTYRWTPDRESVHRLADLARVWCMGDAAPSAWLVSGFNPDVEVPREEVASRFLAEVDVSAPLELRTATRRVATAGLEGRVAMVAPAGHWQRTLPPMVDVLRQAADSAVYGFVKQGSSAVYVMGGDSLRSNWPPRADLTRNRVGTGMGFENELAPDAFPIQLLGPGYRGRIPETSLYRREDLGDATFLEHTDLAAWFEEPMVPYDLSWKEIDNAVPPPVLVEAREALAPILFRGVAG